MSFALAPGEVPLGIKNPLLSPPPLGQMMMQPKFMTPLGTRSLMGLDHSLLSSELEPEFYTDPSIPFQDSPFFESPKPPQPEPQIRRRSIELALDPIDRSEKVSPESSVASIPEAFTEETLESIDESPSEVQSSSELSSEVVPEPAIQRKAFIPEFVEPFSRSESLVQQSRIQPVLDPPTPLGKAGPETGGVRVFEEEAKPIVKVPVIEEDLGGSESSGIMNELNIEPESLESIPETTPIAHSQAIQLNSIQTAEQSASELQTDVLPITTNLDPPSPLEKGGPELGVGLESELPELQSESDAELESDAKLEVEPKPEPELLKSDPTIKFPLTKGDLGGSGSISITSQSEVTDQSSVQLDSLEEISDETIQAQFIETPIAPEITPEVIPEVTPEVSSPVTSEASLEQQPATRSAIQFDPEVIHSEILLSESLSQPNNVLEETAIDAIQPRLAEPITSLESRIYQAHIDTQIDTIAPVIIQPKQDNTVTSIVNDLAINDPIPQEIVQQSKTENLIENSNTLEEPIVNDLGINDAIPQEVVQQSKTQNLVENSNILEAPIANDLAINDAIPQEAVQQTKTENLVENSNILEAPIINKSTIVNESISSPESLQIESPQTQATPNVTDKPQNELPSSSLSSSFPELPRAIQSLSVLEPITQLKPISSLTIDNPILNQPNPQTEATTSRVEESPVIQPFSNPDIQQTPQFSEQPINRKVENSSIRSNPKINPVSDSATMPKISSESDTSWSSIAELLQAPIETRITPQPVSQSTSQSIQTSTETYPEPSFEINQTEAGQTENLQTDRYPDQSLINYTDGYTDGYSNLNLYPEANSPPIEPRIQRELAETTSESESAAIPNHPETNKAQGSQATAAKASPEQLEQLAQEIYRLMRQRLALDRERRGNLYSGRLF